MQLPSGMSGAASGLQAFGSVFQGIAGMASANANASIARQNAAIAMQSGLTQTQNSDIQYRAAEGNQIAAAGASGVWGTTGSPLDALAQSRLEQTYSAMNIMRNAQVRAAGFNYEAAVDHASGLAKMFSSISSATSNILKTQTDYANANNQYGYDPLAPGGAVQPTMGAEAEPIAGGDVGGTGMFGSMG